MVRGEFVDGAASNVEAVRVRSDAAVGEHTVVIECADGTKFEFAVLVM